MKYKNILKDKRKLGLIVLTSLAILLVSLLAFKGIVTSAYNSHYQSSVELCDEVLREFFESAMGETEAAVSTSEGRRDSSFIFCGGWVTNVETQNNLGVSPLQVQIMSAGDWSLYDYALADSEVLITVFENDHYIIFVRAILEELGITESELEDLISDSSLEELKSVNSHWTLSFPIFNGRQKLEIKKVVITPNS